MPWPDSAPRAPMTEAVAPGLVDEIDGRTVDPDGGFYRLLSASEVRLDPQVPGLRSLASILCREPGFEIGQTVAPVATHDDPVGIVRLPGSARHAPRREAARHALDPMDEGRQQHV